MSETLAEAYKDVNSLEDCKRATLTAARVGGVIQA
jgi:hypothetical protein